MRGWWRRESSFCLQFHMEPGPLSIELRLHHRAAAWKLWMHCREAWVHVALKQTLLGMDDLASGGIAPFLRPRKMISNWLIEVSACCSIPRMEVSRRCSFRSGRGFVHWAWCRPLRRSRYPAAPADVPDIQLGPVQPSAAFAFFYNAFMPTIRVTIVSPSPGFYNIQFADANDISIHKGYHGIPEARLMHELEKLSSVSAAEITAKLRGPFPIQGFVPVDEATYQTLFAD